MKRQIQSTSNERRKKPKFQRAKEVESVYDQAEPYRLVTAKFPIDALTPEWRIGVNRPINEAHKRRLCEIFNDVGVLRKNLNHRLRVACTKAQVQTMLDHLSRGQAQGGAAQEKESEWPSFEEWNTIIGERAELMAGNHRVEAFKEHLRHLKSAEERWWICDIYDRGISPLNALAEAR
jgi:hypothetical protein